MTSIRSDWNSKHKWIVLLFIFSLFGYLLYQHKIEHITPSNISKLSMEKQLDIAYSLSPEVIAHVFANSGDKQLLPTYRNKKVKAINNNGRPFTHAGVFPSTNLGAIGYVFVTTPDKNKYVLLTKQIRTVNGKKTLVYEPPAGFINPPYDDETPQCIVEYAERNIDLWQRDSSNINATNKDRINIIKELYDEAWNKYHQGQLDDSYIVDKSLSDTVKREIHEETGLNTSILHKIESLLISEELTDQGVYLAWFYFNLELDTLPNLIVDEISNEVDKAEWVNLNNINFELDDDKVISAMVGNTAIKPYDRHPEMLKIALENALK